MFERNQGSGNKGGDRQRNHFISATTDDRYQYPPSKRRDGWEDKGERPLSIQSLLNDSSSNSNNNNSSISISDKDKWSKWRQQQVAGEQTEEPPSGHGSNMHHIAATAIAAARVVKNSEQQQQRQQHSLREYLGVSRNVAQTPRYSSTSIATSPQEIAESYYNRHQHHPTSGSWHHGYVRTGNGDTSVRPDTITQSPMHPYQYDTLAHSPLPPSTTIGGGIDMVADHHRHVFHAAPHASSGNATTGIHEYPYRSQHVVRTQTDQMFAHGGAAMDMRFHPYPEIHSQSAAAMAAPEHSHHIYQHGPPPLQTQYSVRSGAHPPVRPDLTSSTSSSATTSAQPLSAAATATSTPVATMQKSQVPPKNSATTARNPLPGTKTAASFRKAKRLTGESQRRRRRTQACQYCHAKKIKCEGDGERCNSCIKNDIKCKWGAKRKRGPKPKLQQARRNSAVVGGGGASSATAAIVVQQQSAMAVGRMQASGGTSYLTTTGGALLHPVIQHQQHQHQQRSLAVSIPTDSTPDTTSSTAFPVPAPECPGMEEVDDEYEELQGRGETPEISDGMGGDDDYDYDDDTYDSTALRRLQAPRMDREMEVFFSDKVDSATRDAVIYYFDYFYPLAPMFHPSMFIRRLVNNDVDPLLLDAMKATTARVIQRKTGQIIDGRALALSVKSRILVQMETPTADLLRVIVVMTLMSGSQGEHVSYNSLICLAASLVVKLGWHQVDLYKRPPPTSWDEWVLLEVRRRVFWLVYQTDSYQAMLTGRPMSIAEDSVFVSAPCSDYEWDVVMNPRSGGRTISKSKSQQQLPTGNTGARVLDKPAQSTQYHRSSRSSSGSAASLGQSMRVDQHTIVATGAFSYSFMALCELTAIISRINTFLCDAKTSRPSILLLPASPAYAATGALLQQHHRHSPMFTSQQQPHTPTAAARDGPFPAVDFLETVAGTGKLVHPVQRTVELPSEYPKFMELDERLEEWKSNLLLPEELRDDAAEAADITYFGNADHRRFMMRVRYFCLHCYYVPITLFLHQSNRPSFFTEYERPRDARRRSGEAAVMQNSARQQQKQQQQQQKHDASHSAMSLSPSPPFGPVSGGGIATITSAASDSEVRMRGNGPQHPANSEDDNDPSTSEQSESDAALREMLNTVFARTWNNGLLAYDIEPRSWAICVHAAHGLSEHLDRNSDLPLERFDQVIPFCIFMSVSVLIRQVRLCTHKLRNQNSAADADYPYHDVEVERAKCIRHAKHQWEMLQSLGSLWDVEGMQVLLKSMHIDQVTSATDMLESMSL